MIFARRVVSSLAFALCVAAPALAQTHEIRIRDFGALLTVHSDGTTDVVEQLTIRFSGEWHGINRDLSLQHQTGDGRPTKLEVDDGPITDDAGHALQVDRQTIDGGWTRRWHIYIPGAVDADRTIVIHYRVRNAIRFFYAEGNQPAFDELYWNVTGNKWTMFVDSVHAGVVLPQNITPTRVAAYTGYAGSQASDAVVERDANEVRFASRHTLPPGAGITVAVGWPAGSIAGRPSKLHEQLLDIVRWLPLLVPLIVLVLTYRHWDEHGRDPAEGSYVVHYEPVAGASPAELGTLVDNKADIEDITATLVDLAVRGYIKITELTEEHFFGLSKTKDYQIDIVKPRSQWTDLKPHEMSYLDALTQSAPDDAYTVKMSDLRNKFYRFLPEIRNAIYDQLVEKEYYRERPDTTKGRWVGIALGVGFLLGTLLVLSVKLTLVFFSPVALAISAALSVLILLIFAQLMPARTIEGARAREATLGFKEFLSRVEEDRYKRMITSPALFEKFLPYAMAFGVEEKWARAFRDMNLEPPQWYVGTGRFDPGGFSHSISTMSQAAASSMSSSPSGSGGGGSSGGGSGGGGGSGF